jgi:hypothetical protein
LRKKAMDYQDSALSLPNPAESHVSNQEEQLSLHLKLSLTNVLLELFDKQKGAPLYPLTQMGIKESMLAIAQKSCGALSIKFDCKRSAFIYCGTLL